MDAISQLFYLHGIGYEFTKYTGEQVFFSEDTRKRALQCCGVDTNNEAQIAQLNYDLDASNWLGLVANVSLVEQQSQLLKIKIDERQQNLPVNITVPSLNINITLNNLYNLAVTGEYYLHGVRYIELAVPINEMPIGYHDAAVKVGEQLARTQIWSVPDQVFQVEDVKRTGLSIQLYTLKNKAQLGVGDFNDLLELTALCGTKNMDYILLNPLHLLFANIPERASPYSPNSRALLNPLYISVALSADAQNNTQLNVLMDSDDVIDLLNATDQFINYHKVSQVKYALFKALYNHFELTASNERREAFDKFCNENLSTLSTLNSTEPAFDYYLQWQATVQLALCQQSCKDQGMAIGLINDLAVGCAGDGAEFYNQQALFSEGANVGAPPDPWAEAGQNWGLPALNPQSLQHNNYQYYRSLIRANMQSVGGLRIDHVMAIRRLWWCFDTNGHQDGCYVYYPFEHLLAILKIESHINQSIVIGEDLGIVPPEIKHALSTSGIFSNSLFYFEKQHDGEFLSVDDLAPHCLLMIANHDVPPFSGWWCHDDLNIKQQYELINKSEYEQQKQQRIQEQHKLLRFINSHSNKPQLVLNSNATDVYAQLALCLAGSQSGLFALQIDDLDEQKYPVNIPGTDKEYPNWRRVLTHSSKDIFTKNAPLLAAIDSIRKG
ncbi:4-alpha-glucanotransferase [Pseudoalteromonas carrageenovora]|uniref:4-alpha-glucanotransferase n=1 Tax=Pseudoalteromonas TaxID=53246 RepID=UPI00073209DC|nr:MULTISPECIES: 4-alpha-glucanotransferase [Pseudoalteromonas]KTF09043.1 4-alpha-glucanotransferase [Pseudoalteromonas sp. H103]MDO6635093.1 4-alpha-glucanotransferase [Pseudoalteromonas carrageenovora]MDO6647591.1 4-alpha-glucanotransferase [Pseudoalteromonas carrageenovora]